MKERLADTRRRRAQKEKQKAEEEKARLLRLSMEDAEYEEDCYEDVAIIDIGMDTVKVPTQPLLTVVVYCICEMYFLCTMLW